MRFTIKFVNSISSEVLLQCDNVNESFFDEKLSYFKFLMKDIMWQGKLVYSNFIIHLVQETNEFFSNVEERFLSKIHDYANDLYFTHPFNNIALLKYQNKKIKDLNLNIDKNNCIIINVIIYYNQFLLNFLVNYRNTIADHLVDGYDSEMDIDYYDDLCEMCIPHLNERILYIFITYFANHLYYRSLLTYEINPNFRNKSLLLHIFSSILIYKNCNIIEFCNYFSTSIDNNFLLELSELKIDVVLFIRNSFYKKLILIMQEIDNYNLIISKFPDYQKIIINCVKQDIECFDILLHEFLNNRHIMLPICKKYKHLVAHIPISLNTNKNL